MSIKFLLRSETQKNKVLKDIFFAKNIIFNIRERSQKSYCHVKKGIKMVITWTDQLLMTEKLTLCLNREWTSLRFLVLLTVKHSRKFVECQEGTSSSNAPTVWLADETTENMLRAKCWWQCMDYNCFRGHFNKNLTFVFAVNFFYGD